jgi:hypothetical protein
LHNKPPSQTLYQQSWKERFICNIAEQINIPLALTLSRPFYNDAAKFTRRVDLARLIMVILKIIGS